MNEYSIIFSGKDNSVNKNNIKNIECFRVFNDYPETNIGLNKFVNTLYNDNWVVLEEIVNSDYKTFKCYSSKHNACLFLNISTLPDYINFNNIEYYPTLDLLNKMAINNNNVINIQNYQNNTNISKNISSILDNSIIYTVKNLRAYPTSKRILNNKSKIVLATLTICVTAIIDSLSLPNLQQSVI